MNTGPPTNVTLFNPYQVYKTDSEKDKKGAR